MNHKNVSAYVFFGLSALLAAAFVLTGIWAFGILAALALGFGLFRHLNAKSAPQPDDAQPVPLTKRKVGCAVPVFLAAALFLLCTPPMVLESGALWRYPFQRAVIGMYRNVKEPEWFPDFRKDVERDYHFRYLPGIMQGTGYYDVRFVTSPERAAAYLEQFTADAAETMPLAECSPDADTLRIDTAFFGENSRATVCILDTNRNENHPHSSAVIVDPDTGKIEFSKYG